MESKYHLVCNELNDLGYTESLTIENLPLVEHLLNDLKTTTVSLQKYMNIAKQALEERDSLKLGAEPYKCDNAKLIRECNELHLAFIQFKEQHETIKKELNRKISILANEKTDLETEKEALKTRLKEPEKRKNHKFNSAMNDKISFLTNEVKKLKEQQLELAERNDYCQKQIQNRDKEIKRLNNLLEGGRPVDVLNKCCCYKNIDNKLTDYQDEIKNLISEKNLLQNSLREALAKQHEAMRRALHLAERNKQLENELKDIDRIALAVEAECNSTVQDNVGKVSRLQDKVNESKIIIQNLERDVTRLRQDKLELNSDLEVLKSEKKNLQLMLETEIDDKKRLTDQINKLTIIENDLNMEIDRLSRLSAEQKQRIAELEGVVTTTKSNKLKTLPTISEQSSIRSSKSSKMSMRSAKSTKTKPRKSSVVQKDRSEEEFVNQDIQVELDGKCCSRCINVFKDLLERESNLRQTQISESMEALKEEKEYYLKEYQKLMDQFRSASTPAAGVSDQLIDSLKQDKDYYMKECQKLQEQLVKNLPDENVQSLRNEKEYFEREYKQLLDKYNKNQSDSMPSSEIVENLKKEKDYYMKEYYRVLEKLKDIEGQQIVERKDDVMEQLREKDNKIKQLQLDINSLKEEKRAVLSKIESQEQISLDTDQKCTKLMCKRRERELEMLKSELVHLEEERDALLNRIKTMNQTSSSDQDRLKRAFAELEDHCQKLESERRELLQSQNTRRSTISQLEDQYDILKEQLRTTQTELNNQKSNYNQLKNLHEQTDKTLSDTQAKLLQAETELSNMKLRLNNSSRTSNVQENEIATLNNDIRLMKSQLNKLDTEKDQLLGALDEKAEQIASLQDQMQNKNQKCIDLENELSNLKRKFGKTEGESISQEKLVRSLRSELSSLELQYENERKTKEAALAENKRLQSDVTSLVCDVRDARKELEICKRQVEDLKRQLQHYVAEVKRTEDLISQKELERNEILDQFKSLSEEANLLETNNHTLESEANQSRVQLTVALDHASELEKRIQNQESIIKSYEKQISGLTSQVASLEIQLKQHNTQQDIMESELRQMRDLCVKLDHDKDSLRRELISKEDLRSQFQRNLDNLREENQTLQKAVHKDKNSVEGLEKLLGEARHELIEQRLLNQDLQTEVNRLKAKIDELQDRLKNTCEQLDIYQEKALDYSRQNKQLRRDIANERFYKSHESDSKRYPSL